MSDILSDTLDRLYSQVDKEAVGWRPEPGDKVVGTLVDYQDSDEGEWGVHPILTIETDNGQLVNVHAFHQVLRRNIESKMENGFLDLGSLIAIKYIGPRGDGSSGRNPAEIYAVAVAYAPEQTDE